MTQNSMAQEMAPIPHIAARVLADVRRALEKAGRAVRAKASALMVFETRGSSVHAVTFPAGVPVVAAGFPPAAPICPLQLRLDRAACVGQSRSGQGSCNATPPQRVDAR